MAGNSKPKSARDLASLERRILRGICSGRRSAVEVRRIVRRLVTYNWQEAEHATVFQAIRGLVARASANWRDELPAEATRLGFPDVEWTNYFSATPEATGLEKLIADLQQPR